MKKEATRSVPTNGNRCDFTEFGEIGDRYEITEEFVPHKGLDIWVTVVDFNSVKIDGVTGEFSPTGAALLVNNERRTRLGQPLRRTVDGPDRLRNSKGQTCHDLMRINSVKGVRVPLKGLKQSRVLRKEDVKTDTVTFCPKGTHVLGGGVKSFYKR